MSTNKKFEILQIIGEDRQFGGNDLFIDLIPRSCWFTNVRSSIIKSDWQRLRKYVYNRAGNKCQCCGSDENIQAHQRWSYDDQTNVQKLMRIIALCKNCHLSTHMGRAQMIGCGDAAMEHLMRVRKWNRAEADQHKLEAFQEWRKKNQKKWKLNLDIITDLGIKLTKKLQKQKQTKQLIE